MKKKLNTTAVINELKGASVFFPAETTQGQEEPASQRPSLVTELPPATSASPNSSSPAHDNENSLLEDIRKTIREQGKEVSYVRLTQTEKNQLADLIYSYKRQGVKTTETEIGRIAINYLLEDYRANGKASILARLLASLHT